MKAGKELDALVAEEVMGWYKGRTGWWMLPNSKRLGWVHQEGMMAGNPECGCSHPIWNPSKGIAAVEEVVNHMAAIRDSDMYSGYQMEMRTYRGAVIVRFLESPPLDWMGERLWDANEDQNAGHGDTIPHAICLAALKALNIPVTG